MIHSRIRLILTHGLLFALLLGMVTQGCFADEAEGIEQKPEMSIEDAINRVKALTGPDSFTTDTIITSSFEAILDPSSNCLNYCITDICVRLVVKVAPPSAKIILTPKISHYTPDFVVSSYNENGLEPWLEWRETFAKAESEIQFAIMNLVLPFTFGRGGPNNETESRQGDVSNVRFKEVDIIGNPMVILSNLMAGVDMMAQIRQMIALDSLCSNSNMGGEFAAICSDMGVSDDGESELFNDICEKNPGASICQDEDSESDKPIQNGESGGEHSDENDGSETDEEETLFDKALDALSSYGTIKAIINLFGPSELVDALEIYETAKKLQQMYNTLKEVHSLLQEVQDMFNGIGLGAGLQIDRYFCPTDVFPFIPYYLSQIDSLWWRDFLDFQSLIAFQPFTTDLVYYKRMLMCNIVADAQQWAERAGLVDEIEQGCVVGSSELSMWGTIYPRTGMVIHNNDRKAASVMAERGMDILLAPEEALRLRMPVNHTGRNGIYQPIFPEKGTCSASYAAKQAGFSSIYTDPPMGAKIMGLIENFTDAINNESNTDFSKNNDEIIDDVISIVKDEDITLDTRTGNAWNYWRPYSCCMSEKGKLVWTQDIPDICL